MGSWMDNEEFDILLERWNKANLKHIECFKHCVYVVQ